MTTLTRKCRTYNRLLVICEIYGDDHILAALERARQRTIETTSRRKRVARQGSGERRGPSLLDKTN